MPSVIVDAEDLETLLFALSGIKDVENAIDQRKRNPMVTSKQGKIGDAHDRLSAAYRRAKREVDWPKKVVTQSDIDLLKLTFLDKDGNIRPFAILKHYPSYLAQELMFVEAGPLFTGYRIEWPAPAEPTFHNEPGAGIRYAARLNHYGLQVLNAADTKADVPLIAPPD